MTARSRFQFIVIAAGFALGAWYLGNAAMIIAKAYAARVLIDEAWSRTLETGAASRPWPWADTQPVAELAIPAIGLHEIVLSGDSGATLAFGPGLSHAGAGLDAAGAKLVSAHRDTHFGKLRDIAPGDMIHVTTRAASRRYRVDSIDIVDRPRITVAAPGDAGTLLLATCYPFDAMSPGGDERFVVLASEIHEGDGGVEYRSNR